MKCYGCGEYKVVWIHHGHDPSNSDCGDLCHSYCRNCDKGTCGAD